MSYLQESTMLAYRAPSLLQPHRLRDALRDAHEGRIPPLIGFYCGWSCPPVAKAVAQLGFDIVWIDWEHSACNVETMTQMVHDIQFVSEGRTHAIVRVPSHDHYFISFALDAGASLVIPQVDTVEQAKQIISAAKYGRKHNGTRSAPPARFINGISDKRIDQNETFFENLNRQAGIIIQVESADAINNLDAILTECGHAIDSVWIGTLDLRVSIGLEGLTGDEPDFVALHDKYISTLKKHNMPASGLCLGTPENKRKIAKGKSFLVTGSDMYAVYGQMGELAFAKQNFPKYDYSAYEKDGQ